ncbi:MAG: WYL domain-containing protein [Pseudomonadota bacterium]
MAILSRLERLDRLESWLKSDDTLLLGDAAAELGVSLRTIHRDLTLLRDRGVPVESDRGRGGGVRVAKGWGIGRISLTRLEALDLLVGLALGDVMNRHLQMGRAETIRRKVISSFSAQDQRRIGEMRRRVRIGDLASKAVLDTLGDPSRQVGDELKEAFALNLTLALRYVDRNGVATERLFEPHFLTLNPPVWYVVGWDHLRRDARTLRSDRMRDAKVTDITFALRPWDDFSYVMEGNPTREA